MAEVLGLQDIELVDTPADLYNSTNSVYACVPLSHLSVGC